MITCNQNRPQRSFGLERAPRRRGGALLGAALLASLGSTNIAPAHAGESARLRALNYSMTELEWDTVEVSAPFCETADDSGSMRFERVVDQAMFDQITAIRDAGGFVEIDFGTRIGNSFAGKGDGDTTGVVEVAIDGALVVPALQYSSNVSATTIYSEETLLSDADVASLQVGSVISVTGTGQGVSRANGCERIDQAITSWYFLSEGRPLIQTYL